MAALNLKEVVAEAVTSLGGSATASEVREYIKSKYGKDWKNIETIMNDLSVESSSSFFPPEERVLKRTGQGKYSLKEVATPEPAEPEATPEMPKPTSSGTTQKTLEETIAFYSEKLKQILNQPKYTFAEAAPNQIPAASGVYLVYDNKTNEIVYAGKSRNLRTRLLQQHKTGNVEGSQFRKALGQKHNLNSELQISEYIASNCNFQFLTVDSREEIVRSEHFIAAILAPTLTTRLKQ